MTQLNLSLNFLCDDHCLYCLPFLRHLLDQDLKFQDHTAILQVVLCLGFYGKLAWLQALSLTEVEILLDFSSDNIFFPVRNSNSLLDHWLQVTVM